MRGAVVTGAAGGMGMSIAHRLASDGFAVLLADIATEATTKAADELKAAGLNVASCSMDVRSDDDIKRGLDVALRKFGNVSTLVNNAGVISCRRFADISDEEWDRVNEVNLRAPFRLCRAALPLLAQQPCSRVINIASDIGKHGSPLFAHYCASKFGLIGMTQALALEVASLGMTANCVCPTTTETGMMDQVIAEQCELGRYSSATDARQALIAGVPMGRPARPSDVSAVVSFLASAEAEFITGQAINITGGAWLG
jgi:NAD(P)-dependent dehydrogenase (short-subunit alcohol dehydrogenase family)